MAEKYADSLPYGQFGHAIYNQDENNWRFGRATSNEYFLDPIGRPAVLFEPTANVSKPHVWNDGKDRPSRRREKQVKALAKSYPELQPALDLLPELARVSEAVEDAACRYNTGKGGLIAFGEVFDESRRDYLPAIACPSGPTGSDLRVIQGLMQRRGWGEDRESRIEPVSYSGEDAIWTGPGVALLSIEFARPVERGERYLAVRLPTEIIILRPVIRKRTQARSSRLDVNYLFSISIGDTGGIPHAHMSFNPWFTSKLAVIDQAGRWSVFETESRSKEAKKIKVGSQTVKRPVRGERLLDDGWARIVWVDSASTLCICTRGQLMIVNLQLADELAPTNLDVNLRGGIEWILDIGTLEAFPSHLFALTSSRILVYRIAKASDGEPVPRRLLQMRHHRSPEDGSLRMHLLASNECAVLILRSNVSYMLNQFWFDLSNPDIVGIQLPGHIEPAGSHAKDILDAGIELVPAIEQSDTANSSNNRSRYCYLYLLGKDLSLSRSFYAVQDRDFSATYIGHPTWVVDVTKRKKTMRSNLGGFLVDDEDETMQYGFPVSDYVRQRRSEALSRSGNEWTVIYEHITQRLDNVDAKGPSDIKDIIEKTAGLLRHPPINTTPLRSLYEIGQGAVSVDNIGDAAARLEALRLIQPDERQIDVEDEENEQESAEQVLKLAPVASLEALDRLGLQGLSSLSTSLETIRHMWIEPATDNLLASTNMARNGYAVRMAAEVSLASQILRCDDNKQDETIESQSRDQVWKLPVRQPLGIALSRDPKSSFDEGSSRAQTRLLHTPSASASVSTVTGSNDPTMSTAPEVSRLRKYAHLRSPALAALPRSLNKVLSHWTTGADPSLYDWASMSRTLTRANEDAGDDEMTDNERRQMQRRAERLLRRQRKEAEESKRQQILSSQAPEIVSASQPAQQRQPLKRAEGPVSGGAAPGSSQSFGMSQTVASQVVPGRHGGRPPPRKKRKSGF